MDKLGYPEKIVNMVRLFHDGMQARVKDDGKFSRPFPMTNGVKQGLNLQVLGQGVHRYAKRYSRHPR